MFIVGLPIAKLQAALSDATFSTKAGPSVLAGLDPVAFLHQLFQLYDLREWVTLQQYRLPL